MGRRAWPALIAVVLVGATGCGGSDDDDKASSASKTGSPPATTTAPEQRATRPPYEVSVSGYTVTFPDSWRGGRRTERNETAGSTFFVSRPGGTSMLVIRTKAPSGVGTAKLLRDAYRFERKQGEAVDPTEPESISVDGDDGIAFQYSSRKGGVPLRHREVIVVHDRSLHRIILAARDESFTSASKEFDAILSSLRWT